MAFYKNQWWAEYALDVLPTGSTVICDPPPVDTDIDFMLLMDTASVKGLEERLLSEGFTQGGSPKADPTLRTVVMSHNGSGALQEVQVSNEFNFVIPPGWTFVEDRSFFKSDDKNILLEFSDMVGPDKNGLFHSWKKTGDLISASENRDFSVRPGKVVKAISETRKPDLNLILTCSVEYFENFWKATRLAKYMNLLKKTDRVALFEAVCHDVWP